MPSFILVFSKSIEVSVKANSREELERAAKREVEDRLCAWDTSNSSAPWEVQVSQAHPSQEPLIKKWDCGVVGDRVLAYSDYEEEMAKLPGDAKGAARREQGQEARP